MYEQTFDLQWWVPFIRDGVAQTGQPVFVEDADGDGVLNHNDPAPNDFFVR